MLPSISVKLPCRYLAIGIFAIRPASRPDAAFEILQLASRGVAASEPSLKEPLRCFLDERQVPYSERPHHDRRMWRPQVDGSPFEVAIIFYYLILVTESANAIPLISPSNKG